MKCCTMWWGTAIEGLKNYEWFYNPRSRFCVREEEPGITGCFMNIEPPQGARRKIVNAVRAAKARNSAPWEVVEISHAFCRQRRRALASTSRARQVILEQRARRLTPGGFFFAQRPKKTAPASRLGPL
jgi:hypothetical protein